MAPCTRPIGKKDARMAPSAPIARYIRTMRPVYLLLLSCFQRGQRGQCHCLFFIIFHLRSVSAAIRSVCVCVCAMSGANDGLNKAIKTSDPCYTPIMDVK